MLQRYSHPLSVRLRDFPTCPILADVLHRKAATPLVSVVSRRSLRVPDILKHRCQKDMSARLAFRTLTVLGGGSRRHSAHMLDKSALQTCPSPNNPVPSNIGHRSPNGGIGLLSQSYVFPPPHCGQAPTMAACTNLSRSKSSDMDNDSYSLQVSRSGIPF